MQALPELRELTLDFNDVHSSGALAVAHATVRPRPTLLYSLLFNTPPQHCVHVAEGRLLWLDAALTALSAL